MAFDTNPLLATSRKSGGVNWEYRTYFFAIFVLIALPTSIWKSTAGALQRRGVSQHDGIVHRALREAESITAMIYSA
jgi:hypothetical protein